MNKANALGNRKSIEYSANFDRLANFRKAANLQSCSIQEAISGMMAKHTVSIYDMIADNFTSNNQCYSMAEWEEKIIDHLNYLFLLHASLIERDEDIKSNDLG